MVLAGKELNAYAHVPGGTISLVSGLSHDWGSEDCHYMLHVYAHHFLIALKQYISICSSGYALNVAIRMRCQNWKITLKCTRNLF